MPFNHYPHIIKRRHRHHAGNDERLRERPGPIWPRNRPAVKAFVSTRVVLLIYLKDREWCWLSRIEFGGPKESGISGSLFFGVNSFPWHRANFTLYYDGPPDSWVQGLDAGAVVHWTGQYNDDNGALAPLPARKISAWTTLDLNLNYTFNLPRPAPAPVPGLAKDGGKNVKMKDGKEENVLPVSTAEYNPCGWRGWLNNTTISLGIQNVLDQDPPFAAGSFENGYDESLATIKGRFWYVQLKKRF